MDFQHPTYGPISNASIYTPGGQIAPSIDDQPGDVCPRLPSSNSAYDALRGVPGAWIRVGRDWIFRGVGLIGPGIYIGDKVLGKNRLSLWDSLVYGMAGSTMIEVFVLGWLKLTTPSRAPSVGAPVVLNSHPAASTGQVQP